MRQILVLALLVALSACAAPDAPVQQPTTEPIDGSWQLTSGAVDGRQIPILDDHPITLTFRGAEIGGTAACNNYGARVRVADGALRIEEVGLTAMACAPPEAMEAEAVYLEALSRVTAFQRRGDELVAVGDAVDLVYEALPAPPTTDLVDTSWVLDTLVTGEVAAAPVGEPATLEIRSDGSFSGSTGCRSFAGRWVENANRIDTPEWGLQGECPAGLARQDSHVVSVIGDGFVPTVEGDRLTIADPNGDALVYRAGE